MKKRKFEHWAYLNDEGMNLFGSVFPDKKIPVLSMIPSIEYLPIGERSVFMVYMDELTNEQKEKLFKILADKFKLDRSEIESQINEIGLPLRQELTSGAGTNNLGLFY